jgi:hypothetical protein
MPFPMKEFSGSSVNLLCCNFLHNCGTSGVIYDVSRLVYPAHDYFSG